MANQLGVAYSSYFKGVGVFAAGPYMCAGHNNYTACMYNASISASQLSTLQGSLDSFSAAGTIDNKANIASQKVYMFVGTSDYTVGPNPVTALKTQYTNNGVTAANMEHVVRSGASHTFPTDFDSTGNNGCGSAASPYISNCSYDGAKAVLQKFYGTLNPRNNAPAAGNYIEFNQSEFITNHGMATTGWAYVPQACQAGGTATCTTASNYAHTLAGRACAAGGYTYALGSNQNMGLWNVFVTDTLKQTSTNYYVIGTC